MRRQGTWVALDDHIWSSAAYIGLSPEAAKMYCASYAWCGAHRTDGLLTDADVASLARLLRLRNIEALGAEMIAAGLWDVVPDGHRVVEYLGLNPTAAEVEAKRQKARDKMEDWRKRQQVLLVTSEGGQDDEGAVYPVTADPVTPTHHTTPHHTTPPTLSESPSEEELDPSVVDRVLTQTGGVDNTARLEVFPGSNGRAAAARIFTAWTVAIQRYMGRAIQTRLTPQREALIEARLQHYTEAELIAVVSTGRGDLERLLGLKNLEKFLERHRRKQAAEANGQAAGELLDAAAQLEHMATVYGEEDL